MKLNKSKGRDQLNLKTISAEEMSIARFGECLDRSKVQKLQKYKTTKRQLGCIQRNHKISTR